MVPYIFHSGMGLIALKGGGTDSEHTCIRANGPGSFNSEQENIYYDCKITADIQSKLFKECIQK
jgi:hypothetical protein